MQLVVLALLGCCVAAHSASLSDTLGVSRSVEEIKENLKADTESLSSDIIQSTKDNSRSKRSGGGSGGFLSGIGQAIFGKIASASSGLSSGSSISEISSGSSGISAGDGREHHYESVEYGAPVYGHDENNFDIWSFKKAILNTLFQALKAIGGGVIALKGKLIKGGGVVVSAKGRLISAKGEAISNLGRQIAASAVLTPPEQTHGHIFQTSPAHIPSTGHDSYGPPPPTGYGIHGGYLASASSNSYEHSAYAAPSDHAVHPGLVIVKSLASKKGNRNIEEDEDEDEEEEGEGEEGEGKNVGDINTKNINLVKQLSESFGGNQKDSGLGNIVEGIAGSSNSLINIIKKTAMKLHNDKINNNIASQSLFDNNFNREQIQSYVKEEPLKLPIESKVPVKFIGEEDNNNRNRQYQDQLINSLRLYGENNVQLQQPYNYPGLMITRPIEIPILQSQPISYYPKEENYYNENYFNDNHYGPVKRSGQFISGISIEPSIEYTIKNSKSWRI